MLVLIRLDTGMSNLFTTQEAARLIGVAPVTLKRWLVDAKVADVARNRNGWRVFTSEDIERISAYANQVVPPRPPRV